MMKTIAILVIFLGTMSAQELSPAAVLENVRAQYSHMNDVSALFTQNVKMKFKRNGQSATGMVKIKKGNRYRLETEQQTIVTDGKTIWMYNPRTKQVLRDVYKQNRVQFSPDKFLLGLPKEFTALSLEKDSSDIILTLQPSQSGTTSSMMTGLRVWVNPATWMFHSLEITDKNSTVTRFDLTDIRFNKGIADAEFMFTVTPEMKVVDMQSLK
ncbi:MAG: outer membrane lipoprotein chaperone LolA [Bacteroidota bacterium]